MLQDPNPIEIPPPVLGGTEEIDDSLVNLLFGLVIAILAFLFSVVLLADLVISAWP
jgi:hypothetical protein